MDQKSKQSFDIIKALRNTHKHPVNRLFHLIGIPLYLVGIVTCIFHLSINDIVLVEGISIWAMSITLFILGHFIEGNVRAITIVVFMKYIRSKVILYFT